MRLKDTLARFSHSACIVLPQVPSTLESAGIRIQRQLGQFVPKQPRSADLDQIYKLLVRCGFKQGCVEQLPIVHLKRAPWVILHAKSGKKPLATVDGYLDVYLAALRARQNTPSILSFATVFLWAYPIDAPYFDALRQKLVSMLSALRSDRGRAYFARVSVHGLFDERGANAFGARLASGSEPLDEVFSEAGLDGILADHGFAQIAVESLLDQVAVRLAGGTMSASGIDNVLNFLGSNAVGELQLRYPALRSRIGEALLGPYIDGRIPSQELQERIQKFLLFHFDDPRMRRGNWSGVSDGAIQVLLRWLVHTTLSDFFRVVREGGQQDRDADRMWPYREAFWNAYLQKRVISDAWVVLGDVIQNRAKTFLAEHAEAYGKLNRGGGVKPAHAALILRIGDLVITEWNCVGKYRIWQAHNERAPEFYKARSHYTRTELIDEPDYEGSHHGAESGNWQGKLSHLIASLTGVRVQHKEYMPRWTPR